MTTNNWELEFDNLFTFNGKNPEMNLGITWQLHAGVRKFIEETLESQRQQLIEEIRGEIENEHDDCSCQTHILSLPSLQVNKDKQSKSFGRV